MQDLKPEVLQFLYKWLSDKKIPHIRPGMVEDVEALLLKVLASSEAEKVAAKMQAEAEGVNLPQEGN